MSRYSTTDVVRIVRGWLGEQEEKTWTNEQIIDYLNMTLIDLSSYDILRQRVEYSMPSKTDTIELPSNIAMLWQISYNDYIFPLIVSDKIPYIQTTSTLSGTTIRRSDLNYYAMIDTYNWEAKLSTEIEAGEVLYLHSTIYHPEVDLTTNTEILFEDKYDSLILYQTAMLCLFQTDDMYQKFFAFYTEQKQMLGLKNKIGDRVNWYREIPSGRYK